MEWAYDGWGDFNLVRCQGEKSNKNINFNHASLFSDWIDKWGLIDLKDPCRNYTWSNNQRSPIMARLDSLSLDWEGKYPLANVITLPRRVSDHNPILLSFGGKEQGMEALFRFEKWWLEIEGFSEMVRAAWSTKCQLSNPVAVWQFKIRLLRKKIRGWSRNVEEDVKKKKARILSEIDKLDMLSEQQHLSD
jgi:hypothetical protein